jgi:hypothetical protein
MFYSHPPAMMPYHAMTPYGFTPFGQHPLANPFQASVPGIDPAYLQMMQPVGTAAQQDGMGIHTGTQPPSTGNTSKEPPPHITAWLDEVDASGRGRYMKLRDLYGEKFVTNGYFTLDTIPSLSTEYLTTKIGMRDGEAESLLRWAKHDLTTKYSTP